MARTRARCHEWAGRWTTRWRDAVWLDEARRVAGLVVPHGPVPLSQHYPPIPPATGHADPVTAHRYGTTWTSLAREARDREEAAVFSVIAQHWYAVRDLSAAR